MGYLYLQLEARQNASDSFKPKRIRINLDRLRFCTLARQVARQLAAPQAAKGGLWLASSLNCTSTGHTHTHTHTPGSASLCSTGERPASFQGSSAGPMRMDHSVSGHNGWKPAYCSMVVAKNKNLVVIATVEKRNSDSRQQKGHLKVTTAS